MQARLVARSRHGHPRGEIIYGNAGKVRIAALGFGDYCQSTLRSLKRLAVEGCLRRAGDLACLGAQPDLFSSLFASLQGGRGKALGGGWSVAIRHEVGRVDSVKYPDIHGLIRRGAAADRVTPKGQICRHRHTEGLTDAGNFVDDALPASNIFSLVGGKACKVPWLRTQKRDC